MTAFVLRTKGKYTAALDNEKMINQHFYLSKARQTVPSQRNENTSGRTIWVAGLINYSLWAIRWAILQHYFDCQTFGAILERPNALILNGLGLSSLKGKFVEPNCNLSGCSYLR